MMTWLSGLVLAVAHAVPSVHAAERAGVRDEAVL